MEIRKIYEMSASVNPDNLPQASFKRDDVNYKSMFGARFVAFNLGVSVDELCDMVYDEIKRKIYLNVVKVTLENKYPQYIKNGVNKEVEFIINERFETAKAGKRGGLNTNEAHGKNIAIHLNTMTVAQAVGSVGFSNVLA